MCPDVVLEELEFWGFDEDILSVCCWNRIQEDKENSDTLKEVGALELQSTELEIPLYKCSESWCVFTSMTNFYHYHCYYYQCRDRMF